MEDGGLTYQEIHDGATAGGLALVPTGCTEQQGPHLPVDHDTWFAETILLAASDEAARRYGVESLVLPALPFGPTPEHRSFGAGYIDLPVAVHAAVLEAVLGSLATQGFQRILVWRGCGGNGGRQWHRSSTRLPWGRPIAPTGQGLHFASGNEPRRRNGRARAQSSPHSGSLTQEKVEPQRARQRRDSMVGIGNHSQFAV